MLSTIAPFFGRKMLVWLVDAGGFCVVVSYFIVAISFLVLRYKEPDMPRPYTVNAGKLVGVVAILLTLGMMVLYLPGGPASLVWPYEWAIVLGWTALGAVFLAWARLSSPEASAPLFYRTQTAFHED
jgi:amino acid transporter